MELKPLLWPTRACVSAAAFVGLDPLLTFGRAELGDVRLGSGPWRVKIDGKSIKLGGKTPGWEKILLGAVFAARRPVRWVCGTPDVISVNPDISSV
jgi:hypothetical protein